MLITASNQIDWLAAIEEYHQTLKDEVTEFYELVDEFDPSGAWKVPHLDWCFELDGPADPV